MHSILKTQMAGDSTAIYHAATDRKYRLAETGLGLRIMAALEVE